MKRVAVSQRVQAFPERNETRDELDQQLVRWLLRANSLAFPVPNSLGLDALAVWLKAVSPDAIVLSGGNDIGDQPDRDATERCMLAFAADTGLPVLGICRGMQMMSVEAGSSLVSIDDHVRRRHVVAHPSDESQFPRHEVNSFHTQGVQNCPQGYQILALSADGSIEALQHATLPWEAWMWHPEREEQFAPLELRRFEDLLNQRAGP